jgi:hypothetical protein
MDTKRSIFLAGTSSLVCQVACRPVMTIGWGEIAIILVLVLLLIGPMLWRLFRFIARWRQEHHNERD